MPCSASSGRPAEARLGLDARELLGRGLAAVLDDGAHRLGERVAGAQRRGDRDERVGQLGLERLDPLACLARDVQVAAPRRPAPNAIRLRMIHGAPSMQREDAEDGAGAELDVEQLGGAQRHVGLLEQEPGRAAST